MIRTPFPSFSKREIFWLVLAILALLVISTLPYWFAQRIAPDDKHFMGLAFNLADHFQYFSWLRESRDKFLVPNQLTPENSTPLLFNFLWWSLGRLQNVLGWDYAALYQLARVLAVTFVCGAIYFFCGVVFSNKAKRWAAFWVAVLGSGLGWALVIEKYLRRLPELNSPFAIYTSEPNTFFTLIAFPHFAIAAGLITLIFAVVLLGQRNQSMRLAWLAAGLALLLSVQHAYDMFIIYPVIGLFALFIWVRDRRFPFYLLKLGLIVVLVSVWPALQAFYITQADAVWKGVLAQFDNAGAWTPAPYLLPVLMGFAWLLAIWALDLKTAWRKRDDTHLFLLAWFLSHFVLIYIPLNFQIHLLSGWQVITGVLAAIGLYTRVLPWLHQIWQKTPPERLYRYATLGLLLLVVPTNAYLLAWRFLDLNRSAKQTLYDNAEDRYFLRNSEMQALAYIEANSRPTDVVFAPLDFGQFVPALTGARSFIGHWAQTLNFLEKREQVKAFYRTMTDTERAVLLSVYQVRYVVFTPETAALGNFDPQTAPFLREVFHDGTTWVYEVL